MGTRSRIGVMHGGKCKSVYVHWDGYLDGVGRTLFDHYDSARANHLVALGDISSLEQSIVIPDDVEHSFDQPAKGVTTFYGRDRGDLHTEFRVSHTFEEFMELCNDSTAEYYYVMQDGVWYCGDTYGETHLSNRLTPLSEALVWEAISQ